MTHSTRTPWLVTLVAVVSIALVLPSAGAAPLAPATVPELPTSWAYGANTSNWLNITNATGNYVGTIHSFAGIQVVLNQTNVSANVTLVEVQRTIAFDYQALYCTPTCTNPNGEINASYVAKQVATGFVNFTTGTVVDAAGGTVPALAVLNTAARVQGNLTERFYTGYRNLFGTWKTGNDYLTVQAGGDLAIAFSPAFGLLPTNLTGASSWTSSSAYTSDGNWSANYAWAKNPIFGTNTSGRLSPSGSLTSTGTVTLYGSLGPSVTLRGISTQSVALVLGGPFALRDGILFLPASTDIFQSSSAQSWSSEADAVGPASTAAINLGARLPHVGLLASATTFQSEATSSFPTASSSAGPSVTPAIAALPAQPSASPQTLQAQPESVDSAYQQSSCLQQGSCQGQTVPITTTPGKHNLVGFVVAVLAVAVLVGLIAVGVVSRRRQVPPPPPRINASLYPPARPDGPSPPASAGAAGPRPPTGEAPPANDPLGNLW